MLTATLAHADGKFSENKEVGEFIQMMVQDYQYDEDSLRALFEKAQYQSRIIDSILAPKEKTMSFKSYKPMFVADSTIARGKEFSRKYHVALARAEYVYGVPPEVVMSILAIETHFGGFTGKYRVFDALATIGFYYPERSAYFRKELREFLLLTRDQEVDPMTITGSYAGAMGYPQFMPSSYRAYAVDFDYDGHTDIWNNPVDAIGSIAHYFAVHGWVAGDPVAVPVTVKGDHYDEITSDVMTPSVTVAEAGSYGWKPETDLSEYQDQKVIPFKIETDDGMEYWLGMKNFYVITRYNHSRLYAMTANHLSQIFRAQFEAAEEAES